jgi:acetoin utilization protein AcuB
MRREFIRISGGESLLEALEVMRLARLRHLPIENNGVLVGILSYRDIQDVLLAHLDWNAGHPGSALRESAAIDHLAGPAFSIAPDATLAQAAARLEHLRVGCLPVVELTPQGPRLLGLLTETDLLRAVLGGA